MTPEELFKRANYATCIKRNYGCLLSAEARRAATDVIRLRDALQGVVDWCSEGCPDGGAYSLVEARAALAGLTLVKADT